MPVTLRKSYNTVNKIYFFTATIHKWLPLLAEENNQQLVINYLQKLCNNGLLTVYGFVIMPNHLHIIWQQNKLNGKETPQGSFLKYTAHEFLKKLKISGQSGLYEVNAANKKHEIWQRDSAFRFVCHEPGRRVQQLPNCLYSLPPKTGALFFRMMTSLFGVI